MVQNGLEEQQITIEQFRERIQFTKKNSDFGTEDMLKDMIEGHEEIAYEIDHYLKATTLEKTIESVNHNIKVLKKILIYEQTRCIRRK